jgi:hypothetical protein
VTGGTLRACGPPVTAPAGAELMVVTLSRLLPAGRHDHEPPAGPCRNRASRQPRGSPLTPAPAGSATTQADQAETTKQIDLGEMIRVVVS